MSNSDVFYFNPTCELAIANGSFSYMPPRLLCQFENDCSILPFVFARPGDFILTDKIPSIDFILKLTDAGFEMPEFCGLNELISMKVKSFGTIVPWGWSPVAHFILKDLKAKCSPEFQKSPVFNWTEEYKILFERRTSLQFLASFLNQNPLDFFIEQEMIGTKVTKTEEIEDLLKSQVPLVLKAPLSSSGRGIQILRKPILSNPNRQWISGILKQQKYLIAEPYLEKIADISFQFKIDDKSKTEYLGYSVFETNTNGQYKGSVIHPEIERPGFSEIYSITSGTIGLTALLLKEALKYSEYALYHRGFLGIDAMIYRDKEGLKIQPCIEINSRMNMGILTMQIENRIHHNTTGNFELFYGSRGEFQIFTSKKSLECPLKTSNGKLSSGFLTLVEPDAEKQFGAYLILNEA